MELKKFNNKVVKITDVDNHTFEGICLFEDKDTFDEEQSSFTLLSFFVVSYTAFPTTPNAGLLPQSCRTLVAVFRGSLPTFF